MASGYNDNNQVNAPKDIDQKRGRFVAGVWRPYLSVEEANQYNVAAYRYRYQTLPIKPVADPEPKEYWYRDGTENQHLVLKTSGVSETPPPPAPSGFKWVKKSGIELFENSDGTWTYLATHNSIANYGGVDIEYLPGEVGTVAPTAPGLFRIDYVYVHPDGTMYVAVGTASATKPQAPPIPPDGLFLTEFLWSASGVIDNDQLQLLQEQVDYIFNRNVFESEPITFLELGALIAAENLAQGKLYQISDFQTVHIVPHSAHLNVQGTIYTDKTAWQKDLSEGVEPLIVLAVSNKALAPRAYSELFPNDVIEYDITRNICEDGITPRPGWIVYREYTPTKLKCRFDFRHCRWIRYRLNPDAYNPATTYAVNAVVEYNNAMYVCVKAGTLNVTPSNDTSNHRWALMINFTQEGNYRTLKRYLAHTATGFSMGGRAVQVDATQYRYYPTFGRLIDADQELAEPFYDPEFVFDVEVGLDLWQGLPNNVICRPMRQVGVTDNSATRSSIFGNGCRNNTISAEMNNVVFGDRSQNIIALGYIGSTNFGTYNSGLLFYSLGNNQLLHLTFLQSCTNMVIHGLSQNNVFSKACSNNIFKKGFSYNLFGAGTIGNVFHGGLAYNNFIGRLVSCVAKDVLSECKTAIRFSNTEFSESLTGISFLQGGSTITIGALPNYSTWPAILTLQGETVITAAALMHNVATPTDTLVFVDAADIVTISGFAGGVSGRVIRVVNAGTYSMRINEENSNSLAANQVYESSQGGATPAYYHEILPVSVATYLYISHLSKWVLTSNPKV